MDLNSRGALQDVISEKAATDPNYREALVSNPRNLLEKHLGQELPTWLNVKVVEESADTIYLVAPHVPSEELEDADLEMVAGGKPGGGTEIKGDAKCERNYGAFNSVVTITSEVSLV